MRRDLKVSNTSHPHAHSVAFWASENRIEAPHTREQPKGTPEMDEAHDSNTRPGGSRCLNTQLNELSESYRSCKAKFE